MPFSMLGQKFWNSSTAIIAHFASLSEPINHLSSETTFSIDVSYAAASDQQPSSISMAENFPPDKGDDALRSASWPSLTPHRHQQLGQIAIKGSHRAFQWLPQAVAPCQDGDCYCSQSYRSTGRRPRNQLLCIRRGPWPMLGNISLQLWARNRNIFESPRWPGFCLRCMFLRRFLPTVHSPLVLMGG